MTDNWKSYICNVNGKLASIFLNLGLREAAPLTAKPWLLWVWVYSRAPRPDGLSDNKEAPTLYKIEDALAVHLRDACQATLSGRITTEGRREFYFYGQTTTGFRHAADAAMKSFEDYRFDLGTKHDPNWSQYMDVLHPSADDLERIKNIDVLEALKKAGDVSSVAREVQHWFYFASEESRARFRSAAIAAGFSVSSESESEGKSPFGIVLARTQSVEQASIDQTVIELLHLAQRFDGDYDGWETRVVTQ